MNTLIAIMLAAMLLLVPVKAHAAGSTHATASFIPPEDCIEDQNLAEELGVVQACIQRFSPTHEFTIILNEYRLRTSGEDVVSNAEIAVKAVDEHIKKLYEANESQPGIALGMFETSETLKPEEYGADHCSTVQSVAVDRRVPGYVGEEFRIWAETFICARADASDNSIQVVELRSSERFRVKTDQFKERFKYLVPFGSALEAEQSLKMY
jgi:hypothetical protein